MPRSQEQELQHQIELAQSDPRRLIDVETCLYAAIPTNPGYLPDWAVSKLPKINEVIVQSLATVLGDTWVVIGNDSQWVPVLASNARFVVDSLLPHNTHWLSVVASTMVQWNHCIICGGRCSSFLYSVAEQVGQKWGPLSGNQEYLSARVIRNHRLPPEFAAIIGTHTSCATRVCVLCDAPFSLEDILNSEGLLQGVCFNCQQQSPVNQRAGIPRRGSSMRILKWMKQPV